VPKLGDLAEIFRSKNADPFISTIDIFFSDRAIYDRIKRLDVLSKARVAEAYRMPVAAVCGIHYIDGVAAIKVSILKYSGGKYLASGDPENPDTYGAQQHVPLLFIDIPA
jgi:hypothetical protein